MYVYIYVCVCVCVYIASYTNKTYGHYLINIPLRKQ